MKSKKIAAIFVFLLVGLLTFIIVHNPAIHQDKLVQHIAVALALASFGSLIVFFWRNR